jgi:Protein of unknown function (DUF1822)
MSDKLQILQDLAVPFPIASSFRHQAKSYTAQYLNQDLHEKIYLNILSVLIANAYFQMLNFSTNLSCNVTSLLWSEAIELELVGLGKLECQSISIDQEMVELLPEIRGDRIGYLFIEIADSEKEAKIFGFWPVDFVVVDQEEVSIAELKSTDEMIDYLGELTTRKFTSIRKWLDNIYEADWEPALRSLTITTGQKRLELAGEIFILQLAVSQKDAELISIDVRVQGVGGLLPRGLKVTVPDEFKLHTETVNTPVDLVMIPMEFAAGQEFWVELRKGTAFSREYFRI